MDVKSIKLAIESRLDNVPLLSTAVNKLCMLIPLSEAEAYGIELCVTEAVVNSIRHAYGGMTGHEITVIFTLYQDEVMIEVYDMGTLMDPALLEKNKHATRKFDPNDIESVPESGRGLAIIQNIMDEVLYDVKERQNHLTMKKKLYDK